MEKKGSVNSPTHLRPPTRERDQSVCAYTYSEDCSTLTVIVYVLHSRKDGNRIVCMC